MIRRTSGANRFNIYKFSIGIGVEQYGGNGGVLPALTRHCSADSAYRTSNAVKPQQYLRLPTSVAQ